MTGFWGSYALGHLIAIHTIVLNEKLQGKETSKRDLEQRPAHYIPNKLINIAMQGTTHVLHMTSLVLMERSVLTRSGFVMVKRTVQTSLMKSTAVSTVHKIKSS